MGLLKRLHHILRLKLVRYFRTKEIVRVFEVAHANELKQAELQYWPLLKRAQGDELNQLRTRMREELTAVEFKQMQELAYIRAGRLDIVDRKSWAWPFLPASVQRLATPVAKATPYNLRRMSRTPVPRRAINLIKNAVLAQTWDVRPMEDVKTSNEREQQERIKIAKKIFRHPNNIDSIQTWMEQGIEDMLLFGAFASELRLTLDPERPLKMWAVNIESIRLFPSWQESLEETMPRYAQMTGLKGERGAILFYDDELLYVKDNCSTDNPFGLGKMEVAFMSVNDFLGIQGMSGRAGTDQVHKTWLWWEQPQADSAYQIVRRHIQNELEGQAKVSIIGGMKKPDVLEITPVTEQDLLLNWQELLIRMIANAFDLSALSLGVERDVNRSTGEVLDDKDFRSAVVPMAKRLQEAFTRKILHNKLGWYDLEFAFLNLDDPDLETKMDMYARLYSANATTPNRMLQALGQEELDSPFANLTQFEAMLVNAQAQADIQEQAQTRMADKQQQRQQDMMEQQQSQDPSMAGYLAPPAPGSPQSGAGGGAGQGKGVSAPKPLTLPKFSISGTKYSAKQIAQMPVNKLTDVFNTGGFTAAQVMRDMEQQEPGILNQLSDEVREFFTYRLELEKSKNKNVKLSSGVLRKWLAEQKKRYDQQEDKINDWATWMQRYGQKMGIPGGGSARGGLSEPVGKPGYKKPGGKPGNINPIKLG